jgi:uncharacterized protein
MILTPTGLRFPSLDIVRGVAVMGILTMNIAAFALPEAAYFAPVGPQSEGAANQASWLFNFVLFNNKMRSLFSILFGASCLLIIERAAANGQSPAKVHFGRMTWLYAFGLFHLLFIWWGDILALYALAGFILYFARDLSAKAMWRWAIAMFAFDFLMFGMASILGIALYLGWIPDSIAPSLADELGRALAYNPTEYSNELALMQSGYGAILTDRLAEMPTMVGMWIMMLPGTLGLTFVGMALYRNGFLIGQWPVQRYAKYASWIFAITIPLNIAMGYWLLSNDIDPLIAFAISMGFGAVFQIVMAVGWAAALLWWCMGRGKGTIAAKVLARTGQMAFTNYLGTSIIMTTIFYGYGLGLFGQVERYMLWGFVLAAWAAMMAGSWHWLERYQYGPLEWLWRSLARARLQPMRRSQS